MAIVVAMAMAPGPIFLLLFWPDFAEVAIFVAMIFAGPLVVIHDLIVVPHVIIAVVGVIDPIIMMMFGAGRA